MALSFSVSSTQGNNVTDYEQNPINDLHLRVLSAPLGITFSPTSAEAQDMLRGDVKTLIAEYLEHLQGPKMESGALERATVEIISEDTLRYIKALEDVLQEALAESIVSAEVARRIDRVVR